MVLMIWGQTDGQYTGFVFCYFLGIYSNITERTQTHGFQIFFIPHSLYIITQSQLSQHNIDTKVNFEQYKGGLP